MNFIERAKMVHGDRYDYTNCIYIDSKTKVEITCPYHGNFWQIPNSHLLGHGCPECGGSKRGSKELFIEKAKMIHGDKYDYSKVEYVNNHTKVCIICPEHGEFWQTPHNHLRYGCKECRNQNNRTVNLKTKEDFISKANLVHSNKYDYSNIDYINRTTKICIICPKHGKFYTMQIITTIFLTMFILIKKFYLTIFNGVAFGNAVFLLYNSYEFV